MLLMNGEEVQRIRQAKDVTQAGLSDQTGIPIAAISRFENGKCSRNVKLSTLGKLANGLGVQPEELLIEIEEGKEG